MSAFQIRGLPMGKITASPLLFEQMKSFVCLAQTLNLSKTVRELETTRQTVRRHIAQLEEMKGEALFRVEDRRYLLTDAGQHSLREAQELIARGEAWVNNASGHINGLFHLSAKHVKGFTYHLQQQSLSAMWQSKSPLLSFGVRRWAAAKGQIESPEFKPLRPYLMVFRRLVNDWICVEVGDKSSFATWYGWRWERSSVGRGVADLPGGTGFANLLSQPFQETHLTEGIRLDHIHTRIRAADSEEMVPISYERLLMGCFFPDGSRAIAALINRTHDINIKGLSDETAQSMPSALIMHFAQADVVL